MPSLAERLAACSPEDRRDLLESLEEPEREAVERDWRFWARPNQLEPAGSWRWWAFIGGRGSGKSRPAAEWIADRVEKGLAKSIAFVSRTAADYRDTMVQHKRSGILVVCERRGIVAHWAPSLRSVFFPDHNAQAVCYSAEEPDQLRGPEHDHAWADEVAAWSGRTDDVGNTAWTNLALGLRGGDDPRGIVTTTPKPVPVVKELFEREGQDVVLSRATLYDNLANLPESFVQEILSRYEGTRLARQEIHGELLSDVEGALWTESLIEAHRRTAHPPLSAIVVAVDPPTAEDGSGAECGIVVVGIGAALEPTELRIERDGRELWIVKNLRHAYVLEDATKRGTPEVWARGVSGAAARWGTRTVVAEGNQGGAMVRSTVLAADPTLRVEIVYATESKHTRASPVSHIYEQGRAHHVGFFGDLESQQVTWVPGDKSPDRLDALVWGVSHLLGLLKSRPASVQHAARRTVVPNLLGR